MTEVAYRSRCALAIAAAARGDSIHLLQLLEALEPAL